MCLNPVELADGTAQAQLALNAVSATGQRFGAAHIIDVLRGGQTEKIGQNGHDRLDVFGQGAMHSKREWQSILRQIVAAGFLRLDIGGFGGLKFTSQSQAILSGVAEFHYRQDTAKTKAERKPKTAREPLPDLSDSEVLLLYRLKGLRRDLAQERGVPAYVIFSDRSLQEMAHSQPRTNEEFGEIHGVGAAKLRDLGEIFLSAIAEEDAPAEM
jgi:ATP-dependent DNA helicase RecQ